MPKLITPDGRTVFASRAGAEVLRARGYTDPADSDGQDAPVPARIATRDEWDEHARSVGLNPEDFSSKAGLIDAVEAHDGG